MGTALTENHSLGIMAAIVLARTNMASQGQPEDDSNFLSKVPELLEADMELGTLILG